MPSTWLAIGCFAFIPLFGQLIVPLLSLFLAAWLLALEYVDYHFEHQNKSFDETLAVMHQQRGLYLNFGLFIMLGTITPLFNLLMMPTAICGAALFSNKQQLS